MKYFILCSYWSDLGEHRNAFREVKESFIIEIEYCNITVANIVAMISTKYQPNSSGIFILDIKLIAKK